MLEKRIYARTPDGHFFATRFSGRDSQRNYLLNGQPVHPRILELFVTIEHRRYLERKVLNSDFLGGTLHPENNSVDNFSLDNSYTQFEYLYRLQPHLDWN